MLRSKLPGPLSKLVSDCIESHPPRRPASMNEVATRLDLISHKVQRDIEKANDKGAAP